MTNTELLELVIKDIKNNEFESALDYSYFIEGDGGEYPLRGLRISLMNNNKKRALAYADRCLGRY